MGATILAVERWLVSEQQQLAGSAHYRTSLSLHAHLYVRIEGTKPDIIHQKDICVSCVSLHWDFGKLAHLQVLAGSCAYARTLCAPFPPSSSDRGILAAAGRCAGACKHGQPGHVRQANKLTRDELVAGRTAGLGNGQTDLPKGVAAINARERKKTEWFLRVLCQGLYMRQNAPISALKCFVWFTSRNKVEVGTCPWPPDRVTPLRQRRSQKLWACLQLASPVGPGEQQQHRLLRWSRSLSTASASWCATRPCVTRNLSGYVMHARGAQCGASCRTSHLSRWRCRRSAN